MFSSINLLQRLY